MNRKNIFTFVAVLSIVCGLVFLIIPHQSMSVYGVTLDQHAAFITRYMGEWILGFGLFFWILRKADAVKTVVRGSIYVGLLVTFLGVVISIWDIIQTSASGVWLNVALYGIPLILFMVLYLKKTES